MPPAGGCLHQPVRAVPGVQPEGEPYQQRSRSHAEADAHPLADARHEEDDEHHEHGEQSAAEDEKVRGELDRELHQKIAKIADNPMVYSVLAAAISLLRILFPGRETTL